MEYTQERVLEALGKRGRIAAKEIGGVLAGLDRCGLDAALSALMRQRRVSLALGFYELIPAGRKVTVTVPKVEVRTAAPPPPTAEEEAAASVEVPKEQPCAGPCGKVKPAAQFSRGTTGRLFKSCKACVELTRSEAQLARQERAAPRAKPQPELPPAVVTAEAPPRYLPQPKTDEASMAPQPEAAPDLAVTVPIIDQVHAAAIQELKAIEEEENRLAQRKSELATFLRVYDGFIRGAKA